MMFSNPAGFPTVRPRRLRKLPRSRDMVREHRLTVDDLVYPLFVAHGTNLRREIASMPGQYQLSLDRLGEVVDEVAELGDSRRSSSSASREHKDATGSAALATTASSSSAIRLDQAALRPTCW